MSWSDAARKVGWLKGKLNCFEFATNCYNLRTEKILIGVVASGD